MHAEFFSLNYDISYGSKTQKLVLLKFQLKQPRCSFMSFSVFGTAFPWKPVMLDISFNLINQLILHIWLSFHLSLYAFYSILQNLQQQQISRKVSIAMRWSKIFSWSESPLYTRIIHNLVYNLLWFGLSLSYLFYNYGQNNNYTDILQKR